MPQLWKIFAEIEVGPQDFPSGHTVGFMNIVTWAESADTAQHEIEVYLSTFHWRLIGVEECVPIRENFIYDNDELADLIERATENPDAIILGTFHAYKVN